MSRDTSARGVMGRLLTMDRVTVLASLVLVALNLATTGRWSDVPGAMRGWRWPYLVIALLVAGLTTLKPAEKQWTAPVSFARFVCLGGLAVLVSMIFIDWLPPATWNQIPFLDDWPPRFSSTVEGVELLERGAFVGWQWNLLGGYASSTDITQSLTLLGFVPMTFFGHAVGFHILHVVMYLSVPVLVYVDLAKSDSRRVALIAAGLTAIALAGSSFVRSGDTNSLAGIVGLLGVLTASHHARSSSGRWGFAWLVIALTVAAYSHVGFFAYATGMLLVEAAYYRDLSHAKRSFAAGVAALVISLPLTFELFRYPGEFNFNNVIYYPDTPIDWNHLTRTIGYNAQILVSPWRWFSNPAMMFAPVVLWAAWSREGRGGFYAWASIFLVAIGLLNVPQVGYFFARQGYLLPIVAMIPIAWLLATRCRTAWQALSLAAIVSLSVPIASSKIPHFASVDEFVPDVVARVRTLDGHMLVVENNPHRDVDAAPERASAPSLLGTHYESLLPGATGKRFYAGYWDGWQWTPFRGEMLAGGAWQGHLLKDGDRDRFIAELRRWGVRHLIVWSDPAKTAIAGWSEFALRWQNGPWSHYELVTQPVDVRSVVTDHGSGTLVSTDPLGGLVRLSGVTRGDEVVVRTHYHPAWSAVAQGASLDVYSADGQLAFTAPADGNYDVELNYPARRWLLGIAALACAAVVMRQRSEGRSSARGEPKRKSKKPRRRRGLPS